MKIIIGAGRTSVDGWISTQKNEFGILNRSDFDKLTRKEPILAMLAEHVIIRLNRYICYHMKVL